MKSKINIIISAIIILLSSNTFAQNIERVDPPNWWTGMQKNRIELIVYGENITDAKFTTEESDITIYKTSFPENKNYAFIDLGISKNAKAGIKVINYKIKRKSYELKYEIKERRRSETEQQGINPSDIIYLITPDRFANGDKSNDEIKGMYDKEFDRKKDEARHGGDIKGVIENLGYISDLGMTATWLNPIEENNQDRASYHGYAITDSYKVDPRFGTNNDYAKYVNESHKLKLKVVKDVVYNHFGINHYLIKDMPSKDWIHNWEEYTSSNYRATTLFDPYASDFDKKKMLNGWFDTSMPDINQNNIHVANYLIQNSIWWIENFGIDALRIDTYAYSDPVFMANLSKAVMEEFPQFSIFGETWVTGVPTQSWFTKGEKNTKSFDSHMPGVTDFNIQYAIKDLVSEENGWNTGISKIYYTLSWDYLYENPNANVTFLDNHDVDRFLGTIDNNLEDYKMALGVLLTTRGIPQLFYGAEINMNRGGHHGYLRQDFPGGWDGDIENKFSPEGRSDDENSTWNFISKISNLRKNSSAIKEGKFMQFIPEDGIYIYFRYNNDQTIMVIVNNNKENKTITTERYNEMLINFAKGENVLTKEIVELKQITLDKRSITILDLKK